MVHLSDQCEFSIGHAFGKVELPQRTAAVQRDACDYADDLVELSSTAGGGHLHPSDVVVEINVTVLQPHRMMHVPRDVLQLVAERFQQMKSAEQRVPE